MRFVQSIRFKVLLAGLILLAIPWLGLEYIWQIERYLREGQERALLGTARAVATALHDRPQLFDLAEKQPKGDIGLSVPALNVDIHLDGNFDDWRKYLTAPDHNYQADTYLGASCSVTSWFGRRGGFLFAFFRVQDDTLVYVDADQAAERVDHLSLAWVTPQAELRRQRIGLSARGGRLPVSEAGLALGASASRLEAVMLPTRDGYNLELRVPLEEIGPRIGFEVADVDDAASAQIESLLGVAGTERIDQLVPVLIPESEVAQILRGLSHSTSRIRVLDREHRVLAQAGSLYRANSTQSALQQTQTWPARAWRSFEQATLRRVYARFLKPPREDFADERANAAQIEGSELDVALSGTPSSEWRMTQDQRAVILSAAHPIWNADRVAGTVLVEETTNNILALRNQALETLFNITLAVFFLGALTLLWFASRLSTRIRRLRNEAETAVDSHGRVKQLIAGSTARDEIGDLSRSFSNLLTKLSEHTSYLESMASRLSHELRTPIAVVRSSLENLGAQTLPGEAKVYMDRAQQGLGRLHLVLTSMSEANRLEHMLQNIEREVFDLGEVIAGCVAGYTTVYPQHRFVIARGDERLLLNGAPELMAQLLDKLISNAVDFAPLGSPIEIRLQREGTYALLRVLNEGPPLPEAMKDKLFQSMVSLRTQDGSSGPHLGLGLYIVRMITQFHGGRASAFNRSDREGVEVRIELPLHKLAI